MILSILKVSDKLHYFLSYQCLYQFELKNIKNAERVESLDNSKISKSKLENLLVIKSAKKFNKWFTESSLSCTL